MLHRRPIHALGLVLGFSLCATTTEAHPLPRQEESHPGQEAASNAATGGKAATQASTEAGTEANTEAGTETADISSEGNEGAAPHEAAPPRALEHHDYDLWSRVSGQQLSADGNWLMYSLRPADPDADSTLVVQSVDEDRRFEIQRGSQGRFSRDAKVAVYLVAPDPEALKQARKDKKGRKEKKDDEHLPKNKLEILSLSSGETRTIPRVRSLRMPAENAEYFAYLLEKPVAEDDGEAAAEEIRGEGEKEGGEAKEEEEEEQEQDDSKRDPPQTTLVLMNLYSGAERRYENVAAYRFDEHGQHLLYLHTPEAKDDDALVLVDPASGKSKVLAAGRGEYKSFSFDEAGDRLCFLSTREASEKEEEKPPRWSLSLWNVGDDHAVARVTAHQAGLPEGWGVAEDRAPSFSKSGARILFGSRKLPEPEADDDQKKDGEEEESSDNGGESGDEDEKEPEVKVDIWHWQDPQLQPMQLLQVDRERKRNYLAVLHLEDYRVVQLATPELPSLSIGQNGDGDHALANNNLPYRMQSSWDSPGYYDVWVVDVASGERQQILQAVQLRASLSPGGHFAYWFDRVDGHWYARSLRSGKVVNLTELMPHSVANRNDDHPYLDGPHGAAGWSADDMTLLVYDEYDIWATNPAGFFPPICITDGFGREEQIRLRYIRLDRDEDTIPADTAMLLSAFDTRSKASGFYRDTIRSNQAPREVLMLDERVSTPTKAEDRDRVVFTRQTFRESPNLWVSDLDFGDMKQLSDANPQQSNYLWGSAELFEWTDANGQSLQGVLYKPDGFDPAQKYPMMVYFYERNSQNLHRYITPAPGSSSINFAFYVSRGYLLFVPDIPYREGYPGRSAECAVLPGIARLIDAGFVDKERIGVQGHSWGGYQSAHLVTQTDIFACAESGAPVSNMTSAYGGIRWASGMSRMFQYEKTQSRIGGTLWEAQSRYLENSPIFHVPKINTPLLILHNDQDGAVPWYQGIELFVAMRRLGKACWLFNYNGEAHGLRQRHNRKDWTIRLQQYFDHYLKEAPAPVWLAEGVPALEKGENLGLDLLEKPPTPDDD